VIIFERREYRREAELSGIEIVLRDLKEVVLRQGDRRGQVMNDADIPLENRRKMTTTHIPGFTGEGSLYKSSGNYCLTGTRLPCGWSAQGRPVQGHAALDHDVELVAQRGKSHGSCKASGVNLTLDTGPPLTEIASLRSQ
jgi:hypothetical protein